MLVRNTGNTNFLRFTQVDFVGGGGVDEKLKSAINYRDTIGRSGEDPVEQEDWPLVVRSRRRGIRELLAGEVAGLQVDIYCGGGRGVEEKIDRKVVNRDKNECPREEGKSPLSNGEGGSSQEDNSSIHHGRKGSVSGTGI